MSGKRTDVVIIGGGTAGLTAAIYVQRAGKKAVVLEKEVPGGQIINTLDVENYPGIAHISGADFATGLYEQVLSLGAEFEFEDAVSIENDGAYKKVITTDNEYICKAVIIASGVKRRELGIMGEKELSGKGVSYCATCDGAFFKGKVTAVNGGGNTALDDAVYLSGICSKVYLIHRRDEFRAEKAEIDKINSKDNVEKILNCMVTELGRKEDGRLSSVTVKNKLTGEERKLDIDGLFVAIGQIPANQAFASVVELDESGYIMAGEDTHTSAEGIFAAGDCRTKSVRQLATAAGDGAAAGLAACSYAEKIS